MKVLLFGATGMAGSSIKHELLERSIEVVGVSRSGSDLSCDIKDENQIASVLCSDQFDAVINAAAQININRCDQDPLESWKVNAKAVSIIANFCNELDIDDSILKKIMKLNKRLVVLGEKIAKNLKNVIIKDINNEKTINIEKKKLEKHLSMLKSDNENINNYTDRHNTVIGQNENARLYARSNFLQLLVFFIMAVVITVLSIKAFFIGSSRSMEILAIIMGILMVYFLANYISEKYI